MSTQPNVGVFLRIAAGQRNHPHDPWMSKQIGVEIVLLRQRELQYYELTGRQLIELLEDSRSEQLFGLGFFRAMNVNFRLDDGQADSGQDLPGYFELLVHNAVDASCVGLFDDRAHLGSEDVLCFSFAEQRRKRRHWAHQLKSILFSCEALVYFQEGHHFLHVPKIVGGRLPLDVSVHCVLEQDGGNNPLACKAGTGNDACAPLLHERKHLTLVGPRGFFNSVKTQGGGRAAAALIERRNETWM